MEQATISETKMADDGLRVFLGNGPTTKLLSFLVKHKDEIFSISELIQKSKIGRSVAYDLIDLFIGEDVIKIYKKSGTSRLLCLNKDSENVRIMIDFYEKLLGVKNGESDKGC